MRVIIKMVIMIIPTTMIIIYNEGNNYNGDNDKTT